MGTDEGRSVGENVGRSVGENVGLALGVAVGRVEGDGVGKDVGLTEGRGEGFAVGFGRHTPVPNTGVGAGVESQVPRKSAQHWPPIPISLPSKVTALFEASAQTESARLLSFRTA